MSLTLENCLSQGEALTIPQQIKFKISIFIGIGLENLESFRGRQMCSAKFANFYVCFFKTETFKYFKKFQTLLLSRGHQTSN